MTIETAGHALVLERIFDAPPEKVWQAWSTPEILVQWWAPQPWSTPICEMDMRAGGKFRTVMKGPNGEEFDNTGVFLEVVPGRRIVTTDAFRPGWIPAGPFMVAVVTIEPVEGGKTRYTATAMHWTAETREQHEKMGFHEGWGKVADQLAALLKTL